MGLLRRFTIAIAVLAMFAGSVMAVTPDEVLPDAALEARARAISAELRCMICQNQSIDESDAALAKDLRVLVRQRLVAGDSDDQVVNYVVSRYGEFVLLKPRFSWRNSILWLAPVLLLLAGMAYMFVARRRKTADKGTVLTEAERAALDDVLRKDA